MKVTFLQSDSFVKLGVTQLSAVIEKHGHQSDLLIESGEKDFINSALESKPDLFAFSITTCEEQWARDIILRLKEQSSIPVVVGGPHATFFPDFIKNEGIDYICVGEGEYAIVDLLEALENDPVNSINIPNIWAKDPNGNVFENPVRSFIEDLDELPFPNFDIYNKYKYMVSYNKEIFPVMTARGCPHNCSYCFNEKYKEIYKGKGRYLRRKSPERAIDELVEVKQKYGIKKINFVDDSFFIFPSWIRDFSALYREKINLPFIINGEATTVTEEMAEIASGMGCICIRMGLETGNDELRQVLLNKRISSQDIQQAAGHIKKYGMKLTTFNILGLPGETVENAVETYKLNKVIGTDFLWCSLLQPYPGTAIHDHVRSNGFLADNDGYVALNKSYFVSSRIKLENEKEMINLQKLMQIFIQLKIPLFLVRKIIKLPKNPIFHLMFKLSFVYNKIRTQKIRLIPLARMAWHSLSYMK